MSKFCLACGDPLGTRQLMHDTSTCDTCREQAALAKSSQKAQSGLLQFVEQVSKAGTGRLNLPGGGPA